MKIVNIVNLTNPGEEPVSQDFVRYEYEDGSSLEKMYWEPKVLTEEQKLEGKKILEREWRNSELAATDWIVQIPDHPKKLVYTAYRKHLRDYPNQPDFPNGERPIKPE